MGRVNEHNREVMYQARCRAEEMNLWPSPLEEKMKRLLDDCGVVYESQRIFYIRAKDGWIIRYYIADFYIPDKAIIIEVDGKFHDKQQLHDKLRTRAIQEQYPEVSVLRYGWKDLDDKQKMTDLLWRIK